MSLLTVSALYTDQQLLSWLVIKSVELWMHNGPCAPLIPIICRAPLAAIRERGDYRIGYRAARKALTVSEAHGWEPETSEARFVFVTGAAHWAEPLQNSIEQAALAHEGMVRAGDPHNNACYSYMPAMAAYLDCGPTVDDFVSEAEAAIDFARRMGMDWVIESMTIGRQTGRALQGKTERIGSFGDAEFNESAYAAGVDRLPFSAGLFHIHKAFAAALFRDAAGLEEHSLAAMPLLDLFRGTYFIMLAHLFRALALAEKARTVPEARESALADLEVHVDWLSARAQDAPENFSHLAALLRAERAWAGGDCLEAMSLFEMALSLISPSQRPWHYAFICERQSLLCMEYGFDHAGLGLIAQARDAYASWGATAKVEQLKNIYGSLYPSKPRHTRSLGHTSSASASDIDLLAILKASQALSSETNPETLGIRVSEVLKNMTGATQMLAMFYDEVMQAWVPTTGTALPDQSKALSLEDAAHEGLLPFSAFSYVERTRRTLVVEDVRQDNRFADDPYFAGLAQGSLLVFPLLSHGRLRAILMCENRLVRGVFTAERLDAVNLIAGQLTVSLDNTRLYAELENKVAERTDALETANRQLEELSITDPLTGLANRRHLTDTLASELLRARRSQSPIGMAMVDIDNFKLYNDRYGHILGDTCLRRVSSVLADSVRQGVDLVARYGGEEFAIVLPGANLETVADVAERAREAVAALAEPNEDTDLGTVTISVGVTSITPDEDSLAEELVQRADAALYTAKANGRNRVARN
ncbi:MAG: sensor domain-containing diguanylate cyclase [Coriobacteriia bacterium]|nr:sensor domain-containing diguanylate cyclase [Coriobacteriia bacterium]